MWGLLYGDIFCLFDKLNVLEWYELNKFSMLLGLEMFLRDKVWLLKVEFRDEFNSEKECNWLWIEKWQKAFALFCSLGVLLITSCDLCVCPNGAFWLVEILCFRSSFKSVKVNSLILLMTKSSSSGLIGGGGVGLVRVSA